MVGQVSHSFSATQAEALSNSANVATTWVGPNEWNSVHSVNVTLTGVTSNVSTVSGSNIILGATAGLTVSGTSNSIYFMGPQMSLWAIGTGIANILNAPNAANMTSTSRITLSKFNLPNELVFSRIDFFGSMATTATIPGFGTSTTTHTTGTTGLSGVNFGLWSRMSGTSTGTYTLVTSVAATTTFSYSASNTNTSYTQGLTWGWPGSSTTFSGTAGNAVQNPGTSGITSGTAAWVSFAGMFEQPVTFTPALTIDAGDYIAGFQVNSGGATGSGLLAGSIMMGGTQPAHTNTILGMLGSLSNTTYGIGELGFGIMTASFSTSNALPSSWASSNFGVIASIGAPVVRLNNFPVNSTLP